MPKYKQKWTPDLFRNLRPDSNFLIIVYFLFTTI